MTYVPVTSAKPRQTSYLEDVLENARWAVRCVACLQQPGQADNSRNQMGPGKNGVHKRGRYKGRPRSSMALCDFCKGRRVVFLNRICECGWPAVLYERKLKVWYCGLEACAKHADYRLHKTTEIAVEALDWYGQ